MKLHSTNYSDTFISIAEDCKVTQAEVPPDKEEKTIARMQFEMINNHPYQYSSDDVVFACYTAKNKIPETQWDAERKLFFSKGQPCLRSSALGKRYGWGIHHNAEGKIALYAVETPGYKKWANSKKVTNVAAMRSKKA